jgi:thiol:disulfide interchange protein
MNASNETPRPASNRPWIFGAIFVWAITGAVAIAAFNGRNTAQEVTLRPAASSPVPLGAASIQWETSFEAAMQKAKAEKRPVMVDFYTDWCSACKVLDSDVYTDQRVIAESANWIAVKVNAEQRTDVAQAYGVTGYPTLAFIQGDGRPLSIEVGAPNDPAMMVEWMQTAHSKFTPA